MKTLISLILSSIAVFVAANILPGVQVDTFLTAVVVAVVLGLVNAFIAPLLFVLTLPLNVITLGLFSFVIIAFLVMLVSWIVPGFVVDGFLWALVFAFVLALINSFIASFNSSWPSDT